LEITLEEAFAGTTRLLELLYGRRLDVRIPPGVDNGSRVRVAAGEGARGTIYLVITVKPHPDFQRDGRDLYTEIEVPLEDAILGGETAVPTMGGKVALTIPVDTQNGQRFRLAGQGMPALGATGNKAGQRGDLYATAKVKLPTGLNPEQRDLFRRFRESLADGGG
jgi:DnaJ-class molecular chaperone